jgi:hypothetical protein
MPNPTPQQQNAAARFLIQTQAVDMLQVISTQTVVPANNPTISIQPRYVGLIKGFWVKVQATIHNSNGGATPITPTNFGAANVLSNITFTDLNNNQRVLCPGWYLNFMNSLNGRGPFCAALVNTAEDGITGYGANFAGVITQPSSIAAGADGTVIMWYWVPLAYSDTDYRGAIYANVVNATMQLQLTFNATPVVASGDSTTAVYTGTTGSMTSATVTVYQSYMDQIPMGGGAPILPYLDLSTIYELKTTIFNGMVAAQDFPMQYANFRDFLSTTLVYYNGSARASGTDVNTFALQSANFTNIWKIEPALSAIKTRRILGTDLPLGVYHFSSRLKPIATTQYGNMELVLNPATVNAGAYALVGYEDFALVNTINSAGSLPSGS